VARIQSLEQIQHFSSSALSENEAIRSHPKGLFEELSEGDFTVTISICFACHHTHPVLVSRCKFRCIF
jgi:hypothetical protein